MTHARPDSFADRLPSREPADREVAVGALAGLSSGGVMWVVAALFAGGDMGFSFPLRLVAASFEGHEALDTGAVLGPPALGLLLVGVTSILFGLVFTSILSERLDVVAAILAGAAYATAVWLFSWFVVARVVDPVLYAAVSAFHRSAVVALLKARAFI